MEKSLKDYLHLYLGCECIIGDLNWRRPKMHPNDIAPFIDLDYGKPIKTTMDLHALSQFSHQIKPILRPLSDMTEDEHDEYLEIDEDEYSGGSWFIFRHSGNQVKYLLSKHFDLFGLIEAGLAIDKTKPPDNIGRKTGKQKNG